MTNIITACFGGTRFTNTRPAWLIDHGMVLQIKGVELPESYFVDFANSKAEQATRVLGNADGVVIPDQYFLSNAPQIFAWVYLNTGESGFTTLQVTIPLSQRPDVSTEPPTPQETDLIEQAIAALNDGVERAETAADNAEQSAEGAKAAAENIQQAVEDALQEAKDSGEFDGKNGATFIPDVDADGNISWTNDGDLPNPEPRNIRGPKGDKLTYADLTVADKADLIQGPIAEAQTAAVEAVEQKGEEVLAELQEYADLPEDVAGLKSAFNTLGTDFPLAQGTWERGNFVTWNKRLTNRNKIAVKAGDIIKYSSPTLPIYIAIYPASSTTQVQVVTWHVTENESTYQCAYDGDLIFLFRKGDGSEVIALSDYNADVKIYTTQYGRLVSSVDELKNEVGNAHINLGEWEQGGIDGNGDPTTDALRIRTKDLILMPDSLSIRLDFNYPAKKYSVKQYNEIGGFVSDTDWISENRIITRSETATQFRITLAFVNNANITPEIGVSIFAERAITKSLYTQMMEIENTVNRKFKYFYEGEVFNPDVGGFVSSKYLRMTYPQSDTLNDIAIYGNYLLACINPGKIFIFDLSTKEKLSEINTQQNEHFANVEFSNVFYSENDLFPLLYCHATTGTYNVLRISDLNTVELVKQYTFTPESGTNPMIAFDFIGGIGYGLNDFGNSFKLVKYDLTTDIDNGGGTYTFPIISTGDCPDLRVRQGMKYYNERVYMLTTRATSAPYNSELLALDCNGENARITMQAKTLPFTGEAEGIAISIENHTAYIYITDYFNVFKLAF